MAPALHQSPSTAGFPQLPSFSHQLGHEHFQKENLTAQRCDKKANPVPQCISPVGSHDTQTHVCNGLEIRCRGVSRVLPMNSAQSHTVFFISQAGSLLTAP